LPPRRWWRWCSSRWAGARPPSSASRWCLTLTVTLFASWAWGFTLNRVSLFALIFSIGILVDDAIVVVENIHRHQQLEPGQTLAQLIPARSTRSAARPSWPPSP
jgi:Cu/Ag efflux pump CusA